MNEPLATVIADRDGGQRLLLRTALGRDPRFRIVAEAADGPAAVDAARRTAARLLVLDADLPGLDGVDVARAVGSNRPGCRCVFVTSVPAEELRGVEGVGIVPRATPARHLAAAVASVAAALAREGPPADAVLTVAPDPLAPRHARALVTRVLDGTVGDDVLATVELLASEVVSNAVMHARTEATVAVRRLPGLVRVEVTDGDDSFPARRTPTALRPGGRGLDLVEQLSRSWGIDMLDTGKRTWFEVPL